MESALMRQQLIDYMNQLLIQMAALDQKGRALPTSGPLPPAFLEDLNRLLREFYALWPFWKAEAQKAGTPAEDIEGLIAAVEKLKQCLPMDRASLN
jgi:hypothetical protein